ncbi:hypothetical protein BOTBODRAFT_164252 [Botryobasidium botryosum FD-172 SS1]|uniref:Uncharacterized protein n=1 Tax=Botryobasidium botryosum (strain FD-172 SS1) TaxID=930990 RepID=A0A067M2H1_BOTB1|nr:hypothetical protein BOTBODRAFT_164252 [Botryobasidium botryosum FD-172 SS1]
MWKFMVSCCDNQPQRRPNARSAANYLRSVYSRDNQTPRVGSSKLPWKASRNPSSSASPSPSITGEPFVMMEDEEFDPAGPHRPLGTALRDEGQGQVAIIGRQRENFFSNFLPKLLQPKSEEPPSTLEEEYEPRPRRLGVVPGTEAARLWSSR